MVRSNVAGILCEVSFWAAAFAANKAAQAIIDNGRQSCL